MTTSEKLKLELYRSVIENRKEEIERLYTNLKETLKELHTLIEKSNHDSDE